MFFFQPKEYPLNHLDRFSEGITYLSCHSILLEGNPIDHACVAYFLAAFLSALKVGKEGGVFVDGKWVASHC